MALIRRADLKAPTLPERAVEVPELGGEVAVRGLLLRERLELLEADGRPRFARVGELLALVVRDADGEPLMDAAGWEVWGAANTAAALRLFGEALALSGLRAETEAEPGN